MDRWIFRWLGIKDIPLPIETAISRTPSGGIRIEFSFAVTYLEMPPDAAFQMGKSLIFLSKGIDL
jgi:hypothetical protein